jgi:CheY-like chemotaxis protein
MPNRVLVADDDDGFRYPIVNLLEDYSFEVVEAKSQEEVLESAEASALWIIDVRLPSSNMEGILAVHELARRGTVSAYPVIFVSVLPEDFARGRLAELANVGVHYLWLEKPFELELLKAKIDELLAGTV